MEVNGKTYLVTCVSMGNPHAVIFTHDIDKIDLPEIGPQFEFNEIFPDRTNTEFVEIVDKNILKMRVWERGSGETLACGTGACAVVVAAVLNSIVDRDTDVKVILKGGELTIRWTASGTVTMKGPAVRVFEGWSEI
jgi:diaminopimelate epimerase